MTKKAPKPVSAFRLSRSTLRILARLAKNLKVSRAVVLEIAVSALDEDLK